MRQVVEALTPIVEAGVFPVALGGDHSFTLAELRALAQRHGPLALVQLDAHADTWEAYFGQKYFHGTTFKRAVEEGLSTQRLRSWPGCAAPSMPPPIWERRASSALQ